MSRDLLRRLVRRLAVLGATMAVVAAGALTVQAAAGWRAASAPLDVAPVSASGINADLAAESDRAAALVAQVEAVAGQVDTLKTAVDQASLHVTGDATGAAKVKAAFVAATAQLATLQAQLAAAQNRLAALNAAAAQQAAANAAAGAITTSGSATTGALVTPAATPTPTWSVDHGD